MNYQLSLIAPGSNRKITKRDEFLRKVSAAIPWELFLRVTSVKYEINSLGRPKTDLKLMLGIMILQHLYNLSDPGMEDAIHDSFSFQSFLDLNPSTTPVPDETTILNFRHFLEKYKLQEKLFDEINAELIKQGYLLERESIVDATLVKAPSNTKNKTHSRDPEMSSTKKGNNYHFGMKMHIGVDAESGLVHRLIGTTAKTSDIEMMPNLLHGKEKVILGDKGYFSEELKRETRAKGLFWGILEKRKMRNKITHKLSSKQEKKNKLLSSIRAKVEHPFQVVKHWWGNSKVRYKGIEKNIQRWYGLMSLFNCWKIRDRGFSVA
jgi:IS5 family transposase